MRRATVLLRAIGISRRPAYAADLIDFLNKELEVDPSPRTRELHYELCAEEGP